VRQEKDILREEIENLYWNFVTVKSSIERKFLIFTPDYGIHGKNMIKNVMEDAGPVKAEKGASLFVFKFENSKFRIEAQIKISSSEDHTNDGNFGLVLSNYRSPGNGKLADF
jgi:hypothetical protein